MTRYLLPAPPPPAVLARRLAQYLRETVTSALRQKLIQDRLDWLVDGLPAVEGLTLRALALPIVRAWAFGLDPEAAADVAAQVGLADSYARWEEQYLAAQETAPTCTCAGPGRMRHCGVHADDEPPGRGEDWG
jgi:hypothetical protein